MTDIRVPTLGESVTEATIGKWFKKPGERVAVDEPLVELETDKVTIEVPAPASGILSEIAVNNGETVAVGALLGQIAEGGAAGKAAPVPTGRPDQKTATTAPINAADEEPKLRKPEARSCQDRCASRTISAQACGRERHGRRRLCAGTGRDGRVTKGDMLAAIERAAAAPTAGGAAGGSRAGARARRASMTRRARSG